MPSIVVASVVLSLAVQVQAAPAGPSGAMRPGGIVEAPGSRTLPAPVVARTDRDASIFRRDLRAARREVDRRRQSGELTRSEARKLRREIAIVATLASRYGHDGLSQSEQRELAMHAQTVRSQAAVR